MFEPRIRRILMLAALAVILAAVPVLGQMDWKKLFPTNNPSALQNCAMAYDAARQRVVLFGGVGIGSPVPVNDTWEWDGKSWTKMTPPTSPPLRIEHAMVYDAARRRVVLFGGCGYLLSPRYNDTWEWDGKNWTLVPTPTKPVWRYHHAMAYDAVRQRVVLFGGLGLRNHLNDTWEWDGKNWTRLMPARSPSVRLGHAMAFDAIRQRCVLFGGLDGKDLGDTWEWDGTNWTQKTSTVNPVPRYSHEMAYDATRQRVVLFGGGGFHSLPLNDTWEWDGKVWTQRLPATSPPGRSTHGLTYNTARQRLVLFGGVYSTAMDDTWEWDGSSWKDVTPIKGNLPDQTCSTIAYDAARRRVVLFGGFGGYKNSIPVYLNDTWEWDGKNWTKMKAATSPPGRSGPAIAYDAARKRVVLFGGSSGAMGNPVLHNDTWEWDGKNWTKIIPAASPPARHLHTIVYDAARRRVVLFGGRLQSNLLNDTWEWDGKSWTKINPTASPPARYLHAMAYDPVRQRILLFGGMTGWSQIGDTWEWDGKNWTQRNPTVKPSRRYFHTMALDAARQRVVLFGGFRYANDTWEWSGKDWIPMTSAASPPKKESSGSMVYDAARGSMFMVNAYDHEIWIYVPRDLTAQTHLVSVTTGGNIALSIDAGTAHAGKFYYALGCMDSAAPRGLQLGKVTLLLHPDPYFWLTLYHPNALIANSFGTLDTSGRATATIKVPKLPAAFIGLRFYHAYIVSGWSNVEYASAPVPLTLTR